MNFNYLFFSEKFAFKIKLHTFTFITLHTKLWSYFNYFFVNRLVDNNYQILILTLELVNDSLAD